MTWALSVDCISMKIVCAKFCLCDNHACAYTQQLRITSNHIDANLVAMTDEIQVTGGLSNLIISAPPDYPLGDISAGHTLSPAPEARLVDMDLETLGQGRMPVFVTAQRADGQVVRLESKPVNQSCCHQPDCAKMFPFSTSEDAAKCCSCSMLESSSCDVCVMVDPEWRRGGRAVFSQLALQNEGTFTLIFRTEELAAPDCCPLEAKSPRVTAVSAGTAFNIVPGPVAKLEVLQGGVGGGINSADQAALLYPQPSARLTDTFGNPVVEGCARGCGITMLVLCWAQGAANQASPAYPASTTICRCDDSVSAAHARGMRERERAGGRERARDLYASACIPRAI